MRRRTAGPAVAGALSMLVPGAGQLYAGARRRGLLFLALSAALLAGVLVAATRPLGLATTLVDRRLVAGLLALNLLLLAFRLFAVADAWRRAGGASATALAVLGLLVAATAVPHVAAGYVTVRGHTLLERVFADEEPGDVLAAEDDLFLTKEVRADDPTVWETLARAKPLAASREIFIDAETAPGPPWVTMLLLGSDAGPDQWGTRTDTMIVAALQRDTGRAVAVGIPRNLVDVPLGDDEDGRPRLFEEPLNGLYGFARSRPELFPGGDDPGATAVKQAISRLLGLRVDYYALVDLNGFAELVDVLGGVRIDVKERLVDEVTRPRLGVPKPRIDVHPGRTYHFDGMTALAYVRSRKTSNDYARMARQRCFLTAMAAQLDAVRLLRHFDAFAQAIEATVKTDVPLRRLPDLMQLVSELDPRQTLTETIDPRYFAGRRPADRYPIPDVDEIQAAVRDLVLDPPKAVAERDVEPASTAC